LRIKFLLPKIVIVVVTNSIIDSQIVTGFGLSVQAPDVEVYSGVKVEASEVVMKIAAISDIHGNLGALEAVLADIGKRAPDLIVNLGDVLRVPCFRLNAQIGCLRLGSQRSAAITSASF
jgi:Calcineurin-like phosphoesterase superfamily domain